MSGRLAHRKQAIATLADLDASIAAERIWSHEAVEIPCPPLASVPYANVVKRLIHQKAFTQILGASPRLPPLIDAAKRFFQQRAQGAFETLLARLERLLVFASQLLPGGELKLAMRNFFVPADLLWHHDLSYADRSIRLLWPLGRAGGLRVVPVSNVDEAMHATFYGRERPLVQRLDRQHLATGRPLYELWRHRPVQLSQLLTGHYPFIRHRDRIFTLQTDAISIHRVLARTHAGTLHATSAANQRAPGLQVVITSRI